MERTSQIAFRVMNEGDITEVANLVCDSFFVDEPLCAKLDFKQPNETQFHIEDLTAECARDAISIVAIEKESGAIIGCRLSTLETPTYCWAPKVSPRNADHQKMSTIGRFLCAVGECGDLFARYNVKEFMHFEILNVRRDYRNKGVAKQLVEESLKVARCRGIRAVKVVASNKYTVKLYDRLQYDRLNELRYEDYHDDSGNIVFTDMGVHSGAVLFVKLLD